MKTKIEIKSLAIKEYPLSDGMADNSKTEGMIKGFENGYKQAQMDVCKELIDYCESNLDFYAEDGEVQNKFYNAAWDLLKFKLNKFLSDEK